MSEKVVFIFPGQGAQYPAMGLGIFQAFPEARALFERADRLLGRSFSETIFAASKEELSLTKNSQLALFIVSAAILEVFRARHPEIKPAFCAGLSLGEYTALFAAGVLSFDEALPLVEARGRLMHEACEQQQGVMRVVLGLDPPAVELALRETEDVWIANLNCPGQIVLSGRPEGMEAALEKLRSAGARKIVPLDVSGAFHSALMQSAQDQLEPMIRKVQIKQGAAAVVMNSVGGPVCDPEAMRLHLTEQVTHPVLWQQGIEWLCSQGVDLFIEMGPGKTLAGMNKRIGVKCPTLSIEKVEDFEGVEHVLPIA